MHDIIKYKLLVLYSETSWISSYEKFKINLLCTLVNNDIKIDSPFLPSSGPLNEVLKCTDDIIKNIDSDEMKIISTYSATVISRIRRKIAEDVTDTLKDKILLINVISGEDNIYETYEIDEFGIIKDQPQNLLAHRADEEIAIFKAGMKKRI